MTKSLLKPWPDKYWYVCNFPNVVESTYERHLQDAITAVHRYGWTHYVLDPAFRNDYEKTKYFTFRERFNLVAGVLKVNILMIGLCASNFHVVLQEHMRRVNEG